MQIGITGVYLRIYFQYDKKRGLLGQIEIF